jgi:hypothetical protein
MKAVRGPGRLLVDQQPCAPRHTPHPSGYVAWFEWAEKMTETHTQQRCPECYLWAIWVPKEQKGEVG